MAKKRMLADVLWEAANKHLASTDTFDLNVFSCNAVLSAEFGEVPMRRNRNGDERVYRGSSSATKFLKRIGLNLGHPEHGSFGDIPQGTSRQGIRYMWLLLAMHVAEDEGIEV